MFSQLQKMKCVDGNVEKVLVSVDLTIFMCVFLFYFVFSENPVLYVCGMCGILRLSLYSDSILSSSDK